MSTFNYPSDCTFCKTRIGSDKCLLPFQFVNDFSLPEGSLNAIMEITEIHATYGVQNLVNNKELSNWFPKHQSDNASDVHSNSSITGHFEFKFKSKLSNSGNVSYSEHGSQTDSLAENSTYQKSEISGVPISSNPKPKSPIKEIQSWADKVTESNDSKLSEPDNGSDKGKSEFHLAELNKLVQKEKEIPLVSKSIQNHLIQDLIIAYKCAYSIHLKKRSHIKTSKLFEAINFESVIKSTKGNSYKPNFNTSLDGEIALSKQLIATHSFDQVCDWESGSKIRDAKLCIMEFSELQISNQNASDDTLENTLLNYIKSVKSTKLMPKSQLQLIFSSVSFELLNEGLDKTFDWCTNMSKIKPKYIAAAPSKMTAETGYMSTGSNIKGKIPYPTTDERFNEFIDRQLQSVINANISTNPDNLPTMKDDTTINKYFFILASEFIKRNKGWRNKNSFTSPVHLAKIIESSGLPLNNLESYITFNAMKQILSHSREKFDSIYKLDQPKGESKE